MTAVTTRPRAARTASRKRQRSTGRAVAEWAARWGWRATRWTGRQLSSRAAGHARRVHAGARDWAAVRGEFGSAPTLVDLTTGERFDAHGPEMRGRLGMPQDPRRRWELEEGRAFRRHVAQTRLPWWERAWMRGRGDDPDAVELERLQRRREAWLRAHPEPTGDAPVVPAMSEGGTAMANGVSRFEDLHDPGIDPFEFPEELPDHLAEVAALARENAVDLDALADEEGRKAEAVTAYAEYMDAAEADRDMVGALQEAADSASDLARTLRGAAELWEDVATSIEAARARAEAAYGDWDVPRFDRAG